VILKCHPLMPFRRIARALGLAPLPEHIQVSEEPLERLLQEGGVMVYSTGLSCIEALDLGVPVVHLQPDLNLDLDPLDFAPEVRPSVRTPRELAAAVEHIVRDRQSLVTTYGEQWRTVVQQLLGEVSEETYALFLE
ncbi:MAG: hypothetical protein ACE5JL_14765, partial [Dehalococcoidia bacterium]